MLTDVKSDYSQGLANFFKQSYRARRQGRRHAELRERRQRFPRAAHRDQGLEPGRDLRSRATTPTSVRSPSRPRDLGITQPLLGGDGWESPKLIEIGGKSLEGCFYTNHYS